MNADFGYLYLNLANAWPTFELDGLGITLNGSIKLDTVTGDGTGSFVSRGAFRSSPIEVFSHQDTHWFRLRVCADPIPDGTRIQLFTFTGDGTDAPYEPSTTNPFDSKVGWQAAPPNQLDILILNPPAPRLWVGALIRTIDGSASPTIHQIRVEYGRDTWLKHLPAIYGHRAEARDFLERFLTLHETVLGNLEQTIDDLPRFFDPLAAPDGEFPSWLRWLAGWLAFDLNDAWSETESRKYLSQAFELYGIRGTVEGLRRYLKWYAGVEAHIVEPGLRTQIWSLGAPSSLGVNTMLATAEVQEAIVGISATLDQSHLSKENNCKAVLGDDVVHHFCVRVYCADLSRPRALQDAREVLDREKPAHTTYHLCVIAPEMRVGVQAQVGIDAIVAEGPPKAQFGQRLGTSILAGPAEPCKPIEEDT